MAELYVGIDLGTTNSTVSVIQTDERRLRDPIEHLRSIPIVQYDKDFHKIRDRITLPSYFYCKPDEMQIYTGEYAKSMYSTGNKPMNTYTGIKTRLGGESLVSIPYEKESEEGFVLDMTQSSAILLKTMKASIEEQFEQEIDHLVVTVPAAFTSDERQATKEAILMAGFSPESFHILDEPAATLLYFINDGDGSLMESGIDLNDKNVLIYDIGGGTLDICIARIHYDEEDDEANGKVNVEIISRSKREDLGGNDFDNFLGAYFLSEFENRTVKINTRPAEDQSKMIARIVSQAENYKIAMNDRIKEYIDNPRRLDRIVMTPEFQLIDGQFVDGINLTKAVMEEVFSRLLTDSDRQNILRPVKESISESKNLSREDISLVILTGGMSNFYAVEQTLREYFGDNTEMITVDTTTSVSKGAAIDAYNFSDDNLRLTKMSVQDRLSEDIYVRTEDGFKLIISKNEISNRTEGKFKYTIPYDNMAKIPIFLYYGQHEDFPEDFTPITGKSVFLPRSYSAGETVEIKWQIDKDGVITVSLFGEELTVDKNYGSDFNERKKVVEELAIN